MKKVLSSLLLVSTLLTGCSSISQSDYDAIVAERDYYKEQYENLLASQQEQSDVSEEAEESNEADFIYYLDNMSSEEIVNECLAILNNIPQDGTTLEQYENSFKYKPIESNISEENIVLNFTKEAIPDLSSPDKNAITYVSCSGMGAQMDGTIAVRKNSGIIPYIEVKLCIMDYETAVEIYDSLFNELSPLYTDVNDMREGTSWRATAGFYFTPEIAAYVEDFIHLKKLDKGFAMQVRKHYQTEG